MHTIANSKEEILNSSRRLIQEQGWSSISIRSVAAHCGVSVGSIYNHFSSKSELVCATVESIWRDIFHYPGSTMPFDDTLACVRWLYRRMAYGDKQYPDFFTLHSLSFLDVEKEDGRHLMKKTWRHILDGLCLVLEHDPKIRTDAFDERFTAEKFAGILFSLMLSALLQKNYDPSTAMELVRRTLY